MPRSIESGPRPEDEATPPKEEQKTEKAPVHFHGPKGSPGYRIREIAREDKRTEAAFKKADELEADAEARRKREQKAEIKAETEKEVKILGLFKIKIPISVQVGADTGDLKRVQRPWWSFVAW